MKKSKKSRKSLVVVVVVLAALVAGGAWHWNGTRDIRSTDNAYVNGNIASISSEVVGRVQAVNVHEGDFVHAGDALFNIDPQAFRIAVQAAEANLAQARQGNRVNTRDVDAARAALLRAEADLDNVRSQARRTHDLVASRFLSKQSDDDAASKLKMAEAARDQAQSVLEKAREAVAKVGGEAPAILAAEAQVAQARLNLQHTNVVAPADGWVTNLSLVAGSAVTPNQPLFALIEKGTFWVDANFKETELKGIAPGQNATVEIDMMPGRTFPAVVETLGGGTGAAFSLLPAQNATGNWIKVTQRVPVRIKFTGDAAAEAFRVGASAVVKVELKRPS